MSGKAADDTYTEDEAMRRMNEALKRALRMPPQPHKPAKKSAKGGPSVGRKPKPSKTAS